MDIIHGQRSGVPRYINGLEQNGLAQNRGANVAPTGHFNDFYEKSVIGIN